VAGLPGIDPEVRTLAIDGLRWLLARRGPLTPRGRYPAWIARDLKPQHASRTAWCYGDPGIALTTYSLTSRLGLPTDDALELGREVARRAPEHASVADAGLCHGSAGIAHVCNRLFQASGDELFRSAAREWYARTVALRGAQGPGLGGYMMLHSWPGRDPEWSPTVALLDGAMGVALSLLSAIEPTAPNWDRMMLCEP
jgi:lantibiotic modifying enzyme